MWKKKRMSMILVLIEMPHLQVIVLKVCEYFDFCVCCGLMVEFCARKDF